MSVSQNFNDVIKAYSEALDKANERIVNLTRSIDKIEAENAALKAALATTEDVAGRMIAAMSDKIDSIEADRSALKPRANDDSHWDTCWQAGGHHECAVAKVQELQAEVKDLVLELAGFCWNPANGEYDSMAITSYADALRKLADLGEVIITEERGRRVIARPKEQQR